MMIYLMRGLPASGKSYESDIILTENLINDNISVVRINKSTLRQMLWPKHEWTPAFEKIILDLEETIAIYFFKLKKNIIIDSTNLLSKDVTKWHKTAKKYKQKLKIIDLRKIPLDVCLTRDIKRENSCGPTIILKLARDGDLLK